MNLKAAITSICAITSIICMSCDESTTPTSGNNPKDIPLGAKYVKYDTTNSIMTTNWIYSTAVESDGTVWITTQGGGAYSIKDGQWSKHTVESTAGGLSENSITCVAIDKQNQKWFGTNNKGISILNGSSWKNFNTEPAVPYGDVHINCIEVDANGNVWVGTDKSAAKFDGNSWSVYTVANSEIPKGEVRAIACASDGSVYFGIYAYGTDNGGIVKLSGNTMTIYNKLNAPVCNKTYVLSVDKNNNLWAAGDSGVTFFNGTSWTLYNKTSGNISDTYVAAGMCSITSIKTASDGTVMLAGYGGLYSIVNNVFYRYSELNDGFPYTGVIFNLFIDSKNNKWFATSANGVFVYNESGIK